MKRQIGLNTSDAYTNEQLMNMGKSQFTKVIAAFEQAMIGSAQEKLQQRSDLEALVEQIEQETLEQKAQVVLSLWDATKKAGQEGLEAGTTLHAKWADQCAVARSVLETVLDTSVTSGEIAAPTASGAGMPVSSDDISGNAESNVRVLVDKLEQAVVRMKAGGEIPCHFTTLTTAIYHWQDLAEVLEKYDKAVTQRRHGRRDPLEPAERKLSPHRRRVLKYPGVVAWFTGYKMELFYKHVLKYEDGQGVFEWGAGGIMHLHSINFGSNMPRVDPAQEEWRLPCMQSIRTAQEFASVHEEYVTEWSLSKAEKWFEQDVENAPARWTGSVSPLHSDAESDGSEDLETQKSKTIQQKVTEKSQPGRMSLLIASTAQSEKQDQQPGFLGGNEFCQYALASDEDFVRVFPSSTSMAYVKDAAGRRKVYVLTAVQKRLLEDLDALLQQKDWHPCQIGTGAKKLLLTNNCHLVRRMRRKWYRKLTEKCNMHDRHGGAGVDVPPVYVEMPCDEKTTEEQADIHIDINTQVTEISVGSLNLYMQPLRADVREMISEHDVFCLQEVTSVTLPSVLAAGRELKYDVVSPAQRGHSMLEGFDVCILLRNSVLKRLRVGIVPLCSDGIRHLLHVQAQVKKNGACLAFATAHCTAGQEERMRRTAEMEVIWQSLEALTVDGCIFAGDTNMHVDECISQQHRDEWDDAWEVDGADETLCGTWCHEWMETTHPKVSSWRFDRLVFQTRIIERNVVEPGNVAVTAKEEASTSVDAAVTLLSGKQRKSQSEGVIFLSGKQKQRRVRTESVCLVRNSFQRTWGVGMSDHACISGMFLVQAGATEGLLPEAEYLCVARPGLGPKVARRPAESESCAHKTQSLPFCNKDFEKARMVPGRAAILEDPKRKGLYRLHTRRNCHHVNSHDPLKAMALVANVDDQVVLTIQAAINYLTKYMGKLGTGHTATSRIGGLLDDILCRMQDHDTMTVTSLLSKLFIHTAVPDQICSLEAWHILHDFPRVLSSRFFVNLNAKEQPKLKQLETIQAGTEETTVTRQTKCDIYAKRLENNEFGEKLNAEKVRKMSWAQFVARVDRRGKKFSLRKKQAIVKEKPYLNLDSKRPNAGDMARYALRLHRSFGCSTEDPLALSDTDAVEQLHSFVESALCPMWLKQRFRRQNKVKKVKKVVASIAAANAGSGDGGDVALLPVSAGNAQQASDVTLPSVGASNDSKTSKKKKCRA